MSVKPSNFHRMRHASLLFPILFRSICSHWLDFLFLFITRPIGIVFIITNIIPEIIVAIAWICYSSTCNSRWISSNSYKLKYTIQQNIRNVLLINFNKMVPMHFSKWGAKRLLATGRSQFGHVQSTAFFVFAEPNTSISGISTILNLNVFKTIKYLENMHFYVVKNIFCLDNYKEESSGSPSSATSKPVLCK